MEVPEKAKADTQTFEHYAYDTRDDRVYRYRRLTDYILLQTIPMNKLVRLVPTDFDDFFEGTPAPKEPYLKFVRR